MTNNENKNKNPLVHHSTIPVVQSTVYTLPLPCNLVTVHPSDDFVECLSHTNLTLLSKETTHTYIQYTHIANWCLNMKHLYKSPLEVILIVIMCLRLCEMDIKAVHGYV